MLFNLDATGATATVIKNQFTSSKSKAGQPTLHVVQSEVEIFAIQGARVGSQRLRRQPKGVFASARGRHLVRKSDIRFR